MIDLSNYNVDPDDEAKSAALLDNNPMLVMPDISVTGFLDDDDQPMIVMSFHNNGVGLNFVIDPNVAAEVGESLVTGSKRALELTASKSTKQ